MKTHFTSPIWNHRLQLIWVAFTGLYVTVGAVNSAIWVSSIMITLGALLIVISVAQILPNTNIDSARPTLLLAFASLLFLTQESINVYNDRLAAIFAATIAVSSGLLAWVESESLSRRLKQTVFSVLILLVLTSFTQLIVTISLKHFISKQLLPPQVYIIAPHALGISTGIMLGFSAGRFLVSANLSSLKKRFFLGAFIFFFVIATLTGFAFNDRRILNLVSNREAGYVYAALYTFIYLSLFSGASYSYLHRVNITRFRLPLFVDFIFVMPIVLAAATTSVNTLFFALSKKQLFPVIESFLSEFFAAAFLSCALLFGFRFVRFLSKSIMSDFQSFLKEPKK